MLIVSGDAVVSNPVSWHVADLALTVEKSEDKPAGLYQPKPEIKHLFRSEMKIYNCSLLRTYYQATLKSFWLF